MNNNTNRNIPKVNIPYTEPSVPKPPVAASIIFASIFLFFGSLIPLPVGIIFLVAASAFSAKAFSAKPSLLPILALLSLIPLGFLMGVKTVIPSVLAFCCGCIMFLVLKFGGNKTSATIGSSVFLLTIGASALLIYTNINYGGIAIDNFSDLIDDLHVLFADFIETRLREILTEIENLPDSPQKTNLEIIYKNTVESYSDPTALLNSYLYIFPALAITCVNVISYFAATLYFFTIKEGTGHKVFTTKEKSILTISITGVIIYALSFLLLGVSIFLSPTMMIISLNFAIIYTPALSLIGAKSIFNPEIRRRNRVIVVIAIATVFFNPLITVLVLGFLGANTILTKSMVSFMKKHFFDNFDKKD